MLHRLSKYLTGFHDEHDLSVEQSPIRQLFKLVLLGDEYKKTVQFRNNLGITLGRDLINSIGADFCVRTIYLNSHETVAQIWEISQEEQFSNIRSKLMQGSRGAILIYDGTKPKSLLSYAKILNEMYEARPDIVEEYEQYPVLVIVCNTQPVNFENSVIQDFTSLLNFKIDVPVTVVFPDCNDFISIEKFVDDLLFELEIMNKNSAS